MRREMDQYPLFASFLFEKNMMHNNPDKYGNTIPAGGYAHFGLYLNRGETVAVPGAGLTRNALRPDRWETLLTYADA